MTPFCSEQKPTPNANTYSEYPSRDPKGGGPGYPHTSDPPLMSDPCDQKERCALRAARALLRRGEVSGWGTPNSTRAATDAGQGPAPSAGMRSRRGHRNSPLIVSAMPRVKT
jgi:hypothetical protein